MGRFSGEGINIYVECIGLTYLASLYTKLQFYRLTFNVLRCSYITRHFSKAISLDRQLPSSPEFYVNDFDQFPSQNKHKYINFKVAFEDTDWFSAVFRIFTCSSSVKLFSVAFKSLHIHQCILTSLLLVLGAENPGGGGLSTGSVSDRVCRLFFSLPILCTYVHETLLLLLLLKS
jgi:hypothetical protein